MAATIVHHIAVLWKDFSQVPTYHLIIEAFLGLWVLWLLVRRVSARKNVVDVKLTREEEEELLAEWKPEPLISEVDPDHEALHVPVIDHKPGKHLVLDGVECLNFATHNYLGFAGNETIEEAAIECVKKFGVGSCGPRGFYGTADVHVYLEEKLAAYFGAEQAVLYSYGFSTLASAVPAYAKKGDIIFADECVNFALQKGFDASRSKIKYFRHNDWEHLEQILEQQAAEDKKHPKSAKVRRKFLVVESIYINTGEICPMEKMIELKRKFKVRLFIDESLSFGTLGKRGKGITEHKNISLDDVDLIMASLEYAIGGVGGFCVGTSYVVEHQTLAGLGYCFSASLPPMLAAGSLKALSLMEENPEMFEDLRQKCELMQESFDSIDGLELSGDPISPVKHLRLAESKRKNREADLKTLYAIVKNARNEGIALTVACYLNDAEAHPIVPSIRLTCSVLLSKEDIVESGRKMRKLATQFWENV